MCIACAHSLASQCMEGHWMWDYQMCEAEILEGSGKGHTHAYSHQLVPKNSNFRPRIFLVRTLWTVNDVPVEDSLERPRGVFNLYSFWGVFQMKDAWEKPSEAVKKPLGSFQGIFSCDIIDGS